MSEQTIPPALTPYEWRKRVVYAGEHGPRISLGEDDADREGVFVGEEGQPICERRHALAALALHGQPFGFTREDLALFDGLDLYGGDNAHNRALYERIANLCDRIEALLPPEGA